MGRSPWTAPDATSGSGSPARIPKGLRDPTGGAAAGEEARPTQSPVVKYYGRQDTRACSRSFRDPPAGYPHPGIAVRQSDS